MTLLLKKFILILLVLASISAAILMSTFPDLPGSLAEALVLLGLGVPAWFALEYLAERMERKGWFAQQQADQSRISWKTILVAVLVTIFAAVVAHLLFDWPQGG